jgi:16S rRNA G966 N2-methylase RsmD
MMASHHALGSCKREKPTFYGDNLDILCDHIADESVDLIYLDPPFNSIRNYDILFSGEIRQ